MNTKELVQNIVWSNYYINNAIYNFMKLSNDRYDDGLIEKMRNWDTISDVSMLKKFRSNISKGRIGFKSVSPNYGNTHIYGIWKNLFESYDDGKIQYSPAVEHGLIFYDNVFMDLRGTSRACVATFSSFRKNIIHKYIQQPVFTVGPYIQYSKGYYSIEKLNKIKAKMGKVLLVFPIHSTDDSVINVEEEEFLKKINVIAKSYDTVLVNVFWWNINDAIVKKMTSEGYKICSAGFRDDPYFMDRLKTIISISDFAVGNSVGTHIGYCINENVPFSLIDMKSNSNSSSDSRFPMHYEAIEEIKKCFFNANSITDRHIDMAKKYWGMGICRTSKELRTYCEITADLFKMCKGNIWLLSFMKKRLLNKYLRNDISKYKVLVDSICNAGEMIEL